MILDNDALIRRRAYEIWELEGRPEGRDKEHWFRAAQEVVNIEALAAPSLRPGRVKAAKTAKAATPISRKKSPAVAPARKKKAPITTL